MANVKGEAAFTARGLPWMLSFSINALCALEAELKVPVSKIGEKFGDAMGLTELRAIFRAGLADKHPEITLEQAGELIQEVGMQRAAELVAEAFVGSFPEAAKATAGPRKGAAKT